MKRTTKHEFDKRRGRLRLGGPSEDSGEFRLAVTGLGHNSGRRLVYGEARVGYLCGRTRRIAHDERTITLTAPTRKVGVIRGFPAVDDAQTIRFQLLPVVEPCSSVGRVIAAAEFGNGCEHEGQTGS
ncbi:unannotated protein [freshwater metagenome]|uniref:Unannotated protein n=1 Tax=freshwater metagenome TaxID=449393 RepID=A0A6J6DLT2_9ZZZZ